MNTDKLPKYVGIGLISCLLCGLFYGLWHDFTPEYEAAHPIQYDMIVYDDYGNEMRVRDLSHSERSQNYRIVGNLVMPLTELDEEGLKIQKEQGCTACHD